MEGAFSSWGLGPLSRRHWDLVIRASVAVPLQTVPLLPLVTLAPLRVLGGRMAKLEKEFKSVVSCWFPSLCLLCDGDRVDGDKDQGGPV